MTAASSSSTSHRPTNLLIRLYHRLTDYASHTGLVHLRIAFGILFLWLGILKVFPGVSPAEPLMRASMPAFLPAFLPIDAFIRFAAVWEVIVGIGFLTNRFPRLTLFMTFCTMAITLSIFWMAPGMIWKSFPFLLSFEGTYVVKDLVIAASAVVLIAALRRRRIASDLQATIEVRRLTSSPLVDTYNRLERALVDWSARHSLTLLRLAYAVVFIWFGLLKLNPETEPTLPFILSFANPETIPFVLVVWGVVEIVIAVLLIIRRYEEIAILFTLIIVIVTTAGLFLASHLAFSAPFVLTLFGQHLLKNPIFLGAALILLFGARESR
ncbi:MAG: DoxX family membrane protein [Chloroflexi bacterium]|nr:DoxX family membrane protein [Chloroflexota bacterium]